MLHTFEINDEQEDFTRPWLENSPYADKIKFYIGDALEIVPGMEIVFDLAFVDGNKRFYVEYYEMILQKMHSGGYIIADNTLWDGHVLEEPHHTDTQTIGIKKFNDLVAADTRVEKVILPLRDGLTIIRKTSNGKTGNNQTKQDCPPHSEGTERNLSFADQVNAWCAGFGQHCPHQSRYELCACISERLPFR